MHHETKVDMKTLRAYRLRRVRDLLKARDLAGIVLYEPINIRYATDTSNMQVWTMHNAVRYAFVATEGPVIVFDFAGCEHLSDRSETVTEARQGLSSFYFGAGPRAVEQAKKWAAEIADLVRTHGGGNLRLAVDRIGFHGMNALAAEQIEVHDGEGLMEQARLIKSAEELQAMREAIEVCQIGMRRMREALRPGMTENAVWAILHQTNIELGGEWIETRLLASGPRTNPWFQECGHRVLQNGDILSFDTDLVGPNGYCADISRTWLCGDAKPTDEQKWLFGKAMEQMHFNADLLGPGVTFREITEKGYKLPEDCVPNRYGVVMHGVGMCDEYPAVYYPEDYETSGHDAPFEPGMTICVESYMGRVGGNEGVKLEQQYLITETGIELMSDFPMEDDYLRA